MNKSQRAKISLHQAKDTASALVLIFLIVIFITKDYRYVYAAFIFQIAAMTRPELFKKPAVLWFGFSHYLGTFVSKILLTLVFFLIATPVGLLRKVCGADPMLRKAWKKEAPTVFVDRGHTYSREDLERPY